MAELCRLRLLGAVLLELPTVDTLILLGERPAVEYVPDALEIDCLPGALTLETEDAVCVISPAGSWTGRVGDLGLGLTNPTPRSRLLEGAAVLMLVIEAVGLAEGLDCSARLIGSEPSLTGALAVVLAGALPGLAAVLVVAGDLAGFAVTLTDVEIGVGFTAVLAADPVLAGSLLVPLTFLGSTVVRRGKPPVSAFFSSGPLPFTPPSGFAETASFVAERSLPLTFFLTIRLSGAGLASCVILALVSCRGDSGIGSIPRFFRGSRFRSPREENRLALSFSAGGVSPSVPLLYFRLEPIEPPLSDLCSPIRPSFATAMKLVRMLESGRGDSVLAEVRGERSAGRTRCRATM
jgi:hypothetical protein